MVYPRSRHGFGGLFHERAHRGAEGQLEHALALDVAADGEHHRAGGVVGAVRPQPIGALPQDVRHVRERLDVVDEGRVVVGWGREQPLDERADGPRERRALLDDLLQPRLLAEEVEVGPEDDLDRDPSQRVGRLHLFQRSSERLGLWDERLLQPQERALGPDRMGGDREPLEHLVRVRAEQRPVLEGRRLALRGVAHREPRPGALAT